MQGLVVYHHSYMFLILPIFLSPKCWLQDCNIKFYLNLQKKPRHLACPEEALTWKKEVECKMKRVLQESFFRLLKPFIMERIICQTPGREEPVNSGRRTYQKSWPCVCIHPLLLSWSWLTLCVAMADNICGSSSSSHDPHCEQWWF